MILKRSTVFSQRRNKAELQFKGSSYTAEFVTKNKVKRKHVWEVLEFQNFVFTAFSDDISTGNTEKRSISGERGLIVFVVEIVSRGLQDNWRRKISYMQSPYTTRSASAKKCASLSVFWTVCSTCKSSHPWRHTSGKGRKIWMVALALPSLPVFMTGILNLDIPRRFSERVNLEVSENSVSLGS